MDQRALVVGLLSGVAATLLATGCLYSLWSPQEQEPEYPQGIDALIGNTPLVRIKSLSEATGCTILGKAEFMNPGGSSKDRVALNMIRTAEDNGLLIPHTGSTIFEGTVGSTGISLAMVARARGHKAWIVMPDDQATEKYQLLEKLGATVEKVRPVGIIDKNQFVNRARQRATDFHQGESVGYFADQFENRANFEVHFNTTGPEIYQQTKGKVDALVLGAGTGGTLSGIACYLKPRIQHLKVFLADPPGSGLYNKVKYNTMYSPQEKEGTRRRHQVDTVVEGIGINRLTRNFDVGREHIDDAYRVTDEESIKMSRLLVREDGLFLGSSSAVNCVAAVRVARQLGPGHVIVTLLNDSGQRHLTKFWSDEYLSANGLECPLGAEEGINDFIQ
ncbi:tryptophan synthase beta subunit-like PLP-dependent enzyme [Spinellus fusiger]|nr:tryptophan synthase beta subunit-like PLP-dependent enzyme [Spinellus fusiger]